jgi:LPXTG-motif cell wall-anchored protein
MKSINRFTSWLGRASATAVVLAMVAIGVCAQDTTSKTVRHGPARYDTTVKNAEVVYVEGNDLVLRVDNGKIEHLVVPDTDRFTIDGKELTVHELTAGTKLTQTITTTTAPRYVNTVRTLKGEVLHVNAPSSVLLTLPEGTNHIYRIPSHAKFTIDGKKKTAFDLRKGMSFEATIITDDTETVIGRSKSVVGQTSPPASPVEAGVLLVEPPLAAPGLSAGAEQPGPYRVEPIAATLPKTGTHLPLLGLLGAVTVAMSFGLGAIRKVMRG